MACGTRLACAAATTFKGSLGSPQAGGMYLLFLNVCERHFSASGEVWPQSPVPKITISWPLFSCDGVRGSL